MSPALSWPFDANAPASALAAGGHGRVYLSGPALLANRDGGRTWRAVTPAIGDDGGGTFQVTFAGRDGVVAGDDGRDDERPVLWRSTDDGARWQVIFPRN